jgi:arabinan endo-1,5-alpha-L-arabinosidase
MARSQFVKMKHSRHYTDILLVLAVSLTHAFSSDRPPAQMEPPPLEGETFAHDPSTLLKHGDRYYIFNTGTGIPMKMSTNRVFWTNLPPVFSQVPAWTTNAVPDFKRHIWAPDVIRVNHRYLLYYSISTFGKQVSAIGLATNPTLDPDSPGYTWTDHGPVIQSTEGGPFNAIDPSVMLDRDGRLWMAFGSHWRGIFLIELDPTTGLRIAPDSPLHRLAHARSVQAACLHRRGDYYYLFVNWGTCCRGTNSTYHVRIGRSKSVTGPYLDREGVDLINEGGSLFLEKTGRYFGPGHIGIFTENNSDWFSYHYYDAETEGRPRFAIAPLYWTKDGWPAANP